MKGYGCMGLGFRLTLPYRKRFGRRPGSYSSTEKDFSIDNLLVRIHLSSRCLGGPASRHGSLSFIFQVALHLPSICTTLTSEPTAASNGPSSGQPAFPESIVGCKQRVKCLDNPLSRELGTDEIVKARSWSWLSGGNPFVTHNFPLFARKRVTEGGSEGVREGGREGRWEGGREGGRQGGREGGRVGWKVGGTGVGREGGRQGGREGTCRACRSPTRRWCQCRHRCTLPRRCPTGARRRSCPPELCCHRCTSRLSSLLPKVDIRLSGEGNLKCHSARPVCQNHLDDYVDWDQ